MERPSRTRKVRVTISDEFVGHVLGHAPGEPDGAGPHRVVRELIEVMASQEAEPFSNVGVGVYFA